MNLKQKIAAAFCAAAFVSTSAFAGQFEMYYQHVGNNRLVAIVSFAGDATTQDAQADFSFGPELEFVSAKTKVAGSVCAGSQEKGLIRIVPPSGAGKPLSTKAMDYCTFSFKVKGPIAKGSSPFKMNFVECASPSGAKGCDAKALDAAN